MRTAEGREGRALEDPLGGVGFYLPVGIRKHGESWSRQIVSEETAPENGESWVM